MSELYQPQIEQLRAEVARGEQTVARLEAEVRQAEHELEVFRARYRQIVLPAQARARAARQALLDLEHTLRHQPINDNTPTEPILPLNFRDELRHPSLSQPTPPASLPREDRAAALKRTFRRLARRFHPDLGSGEAEREQLMTLINDAYQRSDLDVLRALDANPHDTSEIYREVAANNTSQASLSLLILRQLWERRAVLDSQLERLKVYCTELRANPWLRLKRDAQIAAQQGRDLLVELAANYERAALEAERRIALLRGN
jgi:hypothetical protein